MKLLNCLYGNLSCELFNTNAMMSCSSDSIKKLKRGVSSGRRARGALPRLNQEARAW